MKRLNKTLIGTAAAAAMAVSATPAMARGNDNGGISAGEVIAGAVVIGAIAAIASSAGNNRSSNNYSRDGYRGDRQNNRQNYGRGNVGPRKAVDRCVRAAENQASRWGRADVTDVRDVDRMRNGYRIEGRIEVANGNRGRYRGQKLDRGRFTCYDDGYGRPQVSYNGLR